MKLIECYIENFGKLSDFKYSFSGGLNTIKKDNGYGKTTLTVFIKAMLYGLDATKKMKLEENDRKHYMPWQGGRCGGSLIIEVGGKRYRIERSFMPKAAEDSFLLYDAKSGKLSDDYTENIGEEIFGIDEDGFERTVFLSEGNLSGKNDNRTVSAKLSGLVGYDGDLSVMDEAIELIDKERKLYSKRGGGGEVGELKARAAELTRRINDLTRKKEEYALEEERLASLSRELNESYEKKNKLALEARAADEARLKRTYAKQYLEMKVAIEKDEDTLLRLEGFFANGVPSAEKIEEAKELSAESKRIYTAAAAEENAEFKALSDFFSGSTEAGELERMKLLTRELEGEKKEAELIRQQLAENGQTGNCLPSPEEIDFEINRLSEAKTVKKVNKSWHITLPCGILLLFLGVVAGIYISPIAYGLSAVGAVLLALGISNLCTSKKGDTGADIRNSVGEFLQKHRAYAPTSDSELLAGLYELRAESERYRAADTRRRELMAREELLIANISQREREACDFIARFPLSDAPTVTDAVNEILRKHDLYSAYIEAVRFTNQKREENLLLAKSYAERAEEFLGLYPTTSARPFDEITTKLLEYNALSRSISRMKASLSQFATEHNITDRDIAAADIQDSSVSSDDPELNAKISELERSKTLSERALREMADDIDRLDELCAQRDELSELAAEYENRVEILLDTKKYLEEAKDLLTSKYLSRTKSAFDKYIKLIGEESGEQFQMSTSFSIMKNERGSYKYSEAYSRGTRELYALAARLALIESLYENEQPFIILDDPFAYFDDKTLKAALAAIEAIAREKQIIYLTCTSARS